MGQAGGGSQEPRLGAARGRHTDPDDRGDNDLDMNLPVHRRAEIKMSKEAREEEPGLITSWFGYFLGAGTQCCGNRVRSDATAAVEKASATGRPPAPTRQQQFPDPNNEAQ